MLPGMNAAAHHAGVHGLQFVDFSGGTAPGFASIQLNRTSNMQVGDFLVAITTSANTAGDPGAAPSGWTLGGSYTTGAHKFAWYWRFMPSPLPSGWTFSWTSSTGNKAGLLLAYRGAGGISVAGGTQNVASNTLALPSISPADSGALIGIWIATTGSTVVTPPAGMTQRAAVPGLPNYNVVWAFDLIPSPAGATGAKTLVKSTNTAFSGVLLQIAEA